MGSTPAVVAKETATTAESGGSPTTGAGDDQSVPKVCSRGPNKKVNDEQPIAVTPMLDALPPLRRAQYLQVVLRFIKISNGHGADNLKMIEKFLKQFDGECMDAQKHVRDLADRAAALEKTKADAEVVPPGETIGAQDAADASSNTAAERPGASCNSDESANSAAIKVSAAQASAESKSGLTVLIPLQHESTAGVGNKDRADECEPKDETQATTTATGKRQKC